MKSVGGCGGCAAAVYLVGLVLLAGLLAGAFVYASMQVDTRGVVVPGTVIRKRDDLRVEYGSWSRELELTVRYRPPIQPWPHVTRVSGADSATFDRLRVGSPVLLRYLQRSELLTALGIPAVRLAGRSTADELRSKLVPITQGVLRTLAIALAIVGLIMLWWKTKSRLAAVAAVVAAMLAFTALNFPDVPPAPAGPIGRATAVVRDVDRVTRLGEGSEAAGSEALAPYQLVTLAFVPTTVGDSVTAIDAIDDGSVPGITAGARLAVTYSLAHPRVARIDGARRTFARKDVAGLLIVGPLELALVLGILALGAKLLRRLRTLGQRRPVSGSSRN